LLPPPQVETKTLSVDYSKSQAAGFEAPIEKALKGLDIGGCRHIRHLTTAMSLAILPLTLCFPVLLSGVLVNNVGMSYPYPLSLIEDGSSLEHLEARERERERERLPV